MRKQVRRNSRNDRPSDAVMTIAEFCEWANISRRQYFMQRQEGKGPREMRLTERIIRITREEAQNWAKRMTERGPK
jgi:hypothetical protein